VNGRTAGAQDNLLSEIKDRGFMRVGMWSIPPESWIDIQSGEWLGVDADFTKEIGKALGVQIDPVLLTHAALAPALNSGRVDAIVGLYKTDERLKVMDYNMEAFWYAADVLITRKDNVEIKTFDDMKGKTLGVVRASAQEIEADELQKRHGVKDIRRYESADPMLLDVKAGRIDAAVWWGYTYDYAVKQNPNYDLRLVGYFPPDYFGRDSLYGVYYTFPKGPRSAGLIKAFDETLAAMRKDGRAKAILDKYGLSDDSYFTGKGSK
jgi:polar amino acid transport system substrate-binding protein